MISRSLYASFVIAALLSVSLAASGCGGGSNGGQNANSGATAAGQAMNGAAPIPASLKCKTQVVWVNLSTRVYHEQNDPWFGRTHNGEYMCLAEANLKGYRLAGSAGGSMNQDMSGSGSHHHHHTEPNPSDT